MAINRLFKADGVIESDSAARLIEPARAISSIYLRFTSVRITDPSFFRLFSTLSVLIFAPLKVKFNSRQQHPPSLKMSVEERSRLSSSPILKF